MARRKGVLVMDAEAVETAIQRIAHEIIEQGEDGRELTLVGIRTRGVPLAERLANALESISGKRPAVGVLDINLYRDDLSMIADHPVLRKTEIPFDLDGAGLVLVDDVLFTGRTIRAALDGLTDLGRPAWIRLAVLVDRGHREVPIRADYVGKNIPTSRSQRVDVWIDEVDGKDEVRVQRDDEAADARGKA